MTFKCCSVEIQQHDEYQNFAMLQDTSFYPNWSEQVTTEVALKIDKLFNELTTTSDTDMIPL